MVSFFQEHGPVSILLSSLSRVEIQSVLVRLESTHQLPAGEVTRIANTIEQVWPDVTEVPMTDLLVQVATKLVIARKLRTLDALQLAAALAAPPSKNLVFVSSDRKLLAAAKAEGFAIFDPMAGL